MPDGPLGMPRPFVDDKAEVNIYFDEHNLTENDISPARTVIHNHPIFDGPASGPVGNLGNVMTFATRDNSLTLSAMSSLKEKIEDATGLWIQEMEVIV